VTEKATEAETLTLEIKEFQQNNDVCSYKL